MSMNIFCSQELEIERIGGNDQCMIQYYHILGCCRVPGEGVDHVDCHLAHDPTAPRHVTIVHNNHVSMRYILESYCRTFSQNSPYFI
jgi:hypothetical protein